MTCHIWVPAGWTTHLCNDRNISSSIFKEVGNYYYISTLYPIYTYLTTLHSILYTLSSILYPLYTTLHPLSTPLSTPLPPEPTYPTPHTRSPPIHLLDPQRQPPLRLTRNPALHHQRPPLPPFIPHLNKLKPPHQRRQQRLKLQPGKVPPNTPPRPVQKRQNIIVTRAPLLPPAVLLPAARVELPGGGAPDLRRPVDRPGAEHHERALGDGVSAEGGVLGGGAEGQRDGGEEPEDFVGDGAQVGECVEGVF